MATAISVTTAIVSNCLFAVGLDNFASSRFRSPANCADFASSRRAMAEPKSQIAVPRLHLPFEAGRFASMYPSKLGEPVA